MNLWMRLIAHHGEAELAQHKLDGLQDVLKTLLRQLMTAQLRVNEQVLDALGVAILD